MASSKYPAPADETKIDVFVRCRGRNEREVRENSGVVVNTNGVKGTTLELSVGANAPNNKTYTFDAVFSPLADQLMIFDEIVVPVLDEVRKGFNCTIFAYGQTGTGKTYTMSGDIADRPILSDDAGIIPRVLRAIFQGLDVPNHSLPADSVPENSVKVSFIELYNEELRDLLSCEEKSNLKIFDGDNKKGGGTIVQGMEEQYITNAKAGLELLRAGSFKRQVAATKCNDLSSRSHTIFTVTVHTKRVLASGEEILSTGKLNLVDLAGSENIGRSGAENKRATEAGLINKSLLTLGRVINALVDRSSHIPYRESKLTRILQDSLGGRTKTCIIATLSPARLNLEETISSLDYAFRAKNIRNKPQINQTVPKWTFLKDVSLEIERLKSELNAARLRNGVYLSADAYDALNQENDSLKVHAREQQEKIGTLESKLSRKGQDLLELASLFETVETEHEMTRASLEGANKSLTESKSSVIRYQQLLNDETRRCTRQEQFLERLTAHNERLRKKLDHSTSDNASLHDKLHRTFSLQERNHDRHDGVRRDMAETLSMLDDRLAKFQDEQRQLIDGLTQALHTSIKTEQDELDKTKSRIVEESVKYGDSHAEIVTQSSCDEAELNEALDNVKSQQMMLKSKMESGFSQLSETLSRIPNSVLSNITAFHSQLDRSYSKLGDDYRSAFNEMSADLIAQHVTLHRIQDDMAVANEGLERDQSKSMSALSAFVEQEKMQRDRESADLLSHIQQLVQENSNQQSLRLTLVEDKAAELQSAARRHSAAGRIFNKETVSLLGQVKTLHEKVSGIRDDMVVRVKADLAAAVQYTATLEAATSAIHEETTQVVGSQSEQALADMESVIAKIETARTMHSQSASTTMELVSQLGTTTKASYDELDSRVERCHTQTASMAVLLTEQGDALRARLPEFEEDGLIRQGLAEATDRNQQAELEEYIITGRTPVRDDKVYFVENAPTFEGVIDERDESLRLDLESPRPKSPNKMLVFVDERERRRTQQRPPMANSGDATSENMGLRELDANSRLRPAPEDASTKAIKNSSRLDKEDVDSVVLARVPSLKRSAPNNSAMEEKVVTKARRARNGRIASNPEMKNIEEVTALHGSVNGRKQAVVKTARRLRSYDKNDMGS